MDAGWNVVSQTPMQGAGLPQKAASQNGAAGWNVVSQTVAPNAPSDQDFVSRILQQESGGKDYNRNGSPVTSKKGALFAMQVMPSTARDPGFGIQPAKAQTPAEYNRVGKELLGALLKKYNGNEQFAAAAYNMGHAAFDAWRRGKASLPAETRNYVKKVTGVDLGGEPAISSRGPAPHWYDVSNPEIREKVANTLQPVIDMVGMGLGATSGAVLGGGVGSVPGAGIGLAAAGEIGNTIRGQRNVEANRIMAGLPRKQNEFTEGLKNFAVGSVFQAMPEVGLGVLKAAGPEAVTTMSKALPWWAHSERGPDTAAAAEAVGKQTPKAGIRVPVSAKASPQIEEAFRDKLVDAFTDISERSNGKPPQSIGELSKAMEKGRKAAYDAYHGMVEDGAKKGALVDLRPAANVLNEYAAREEIKIHHPDEARQLKRLAKLYHKNRLVAPEKAEKFVEQLNDLGESVYKTPSSWADKQGAYARASGRLRDSIAKSLRDVGLDSDEYLRQRRLYGAYSTVRKPITRALVAAKDRPGLLRTILRDKWNAWDIPGAAVGIAAGHPTLGIGAALARPAWDVVKWYTENPNRIVAALFRDLENALTPASSLSALGHGAVGAASVAGR